jgi:photosystem II stability/assembly factor-like uncharacterized protein
MLIAMILVFTIKDIKSENMFSNIPFYLYTEAKSMVISPTGYIIVSGWGSGIKKTTDAGTTFFDINTGLSTKFITTLAIGNNGYLYAGTYGFGLYRSTNNGSNWSIVFNKPNANIIKAITVSPSGDIWVGTQGGGIYLSENSGGIWNEKNVGLTYRDVTSMIAFNDNVILAGTSNRGIFKSSDKGESWYHSSPGLDTATISCFYMDSLNQVYVGTQGSGVYVSINGGADWISYHRTNSPKNITAIAGFKTDAVLVGTNDIGIWRYDLTYENWRSPWQNYDGVNDLKLASGTQYYALQPYSGFLRTMDNLGYDWGYKNLGVNTGYKTLAFIDDNIYVANGDNGMLRSTDLGMTWSPTPLLSGTIVQFMAKDSSGNLFASANTSGMSMKGYIYKSLDNGLNWTAIISKTDTSFFGITVKPSGTMFIEASWAPAGTSDPKTTTHGTIMKSTDGGITWARTAASCANPGNFLTINANGVVFGQLLAGLGKTTNDGTTWLAITGSNIEVTDAKVDKNNVLWIASSEGVKKSTNTGTTWISYAANATNTAAKKLQITKSGNIYASIDNKYPYLVKTSDDGATWVPVVSGISHRNIESIVMNQSGLMLLTGVSTYKGIESNDLPKPTLINLKKDSAGVTVNPRFNWNKSKYADMYEFQISNTTDFSNIIEDYVIADTTWKLMTTLDFNQPYVWRVRAKMNSALSNWSEERMFYTIMAPPTLISPKNGTTGLKTAVDFVWKKVNGAGQYYLSVSTDSTFATNLVVNNKMVDDTIYSATNLQLLTQYYWKVYAVTPVTKSDWSATWKFKTTLKPVTLISPKNGSYGEQKNVTFTWDTTKTATNYFIEVALDEEFNTKIFAGNANQMNKHVIEILELNTTYYWRVYAFNSEGYSDYSDIWRFTTSMDVTTLISPPDASKDLALSVDFSWKSNADATKYHLMVASDIGFKNILVNDSNLTTPNYSLKDLNHYSTYYWKVKFKKNTLSGLWSSVWNFSTNLDKPTLKYPASLTDKMPQIIALEWNKLTGAKYYELQYAKQSDFTGTLNIVDSLTNLTLETPKLEFGATYYWRIRGKYDFGMSPWSEVWNFKIRDDNSDVEDLQTESLEIYPNPFSEAVNIRLYINKDIKTKINIIDLQGNNVFNVFDGFKGIGMHLFTYYPSSKIASGNYFVKINVGKTEIIKPIILNK